MPVRFRCRECSEHLEIPSSHFGKDAFCTACGASIRVPTPVKHECGSCGRSAVLNGNHDGKDCSCGGKLTATQVFIKKRTGDISKVFDLTDLDDGPDDF